MSQRPFDDIRALLSDLPAPGLTSPVAGIGKLAPIAAWIAAWRGRPEVNRPILALYAGAHVGGGDPGEAHARLEAIAAGEAPVAKAAGNLGAGLDVFDLAIDRPVPDIAGGPAMSERECAATMAFGMEALAKQPDLLLLGAFGPGAGDAAAALIAALGGEAPASPRAGAAAERVLAAGETDPLERLRQLGGRETAALAGAILAARTQRVPVLLDGAPALAAAAVLAGLDADAIAHCRVASQHPAAAAIGLVVLPGAALGLDDGTGALAGLGLVKLACAVAS
jgi:nicotinate-nucleotide--dimethylbenzimidazole phosphoribosyltransferase